MKNEPIMSGGMEDLARMLGRLRSETPEIERKGRAAEPPAPASVGDTMRHGVPCARGRRPLPGPAADPASVGDTMRHGVPAIWAENKETLLFGLLISALVSALGVIGGYPYLVLLGAVSFALFALASFLTLAGYYQRHRWRSPESDIGEKVERLRRKIETLELRASSTAPAQYAPGQLNASQEKELERRIEELRTIVTALSRAVENPGRRR